MANRSKASRSAAAKKAAATRKRNASKRSAAAKKAAATRKRNASKGKRKATRSSKSSRSAAAKKAAATRKRNASKRSAAAKKAAATRKRNASKGKRKSVRSTKASRSAAAKKAAATRKRNASKRKSAAKKAAATRKRNARKGSRKSGRPTAAKRRAAAKKAAATRKRNASKRSRAAKKAAATRKRNAGKRKGSRKARKMGVAKQGKSVYDSFMKGTDMLVPGMITVGTALVGMGLYNSIKSMAWDRFNVTGSTGYIQQAADMIPVITPSMAADLGNFGNKALHTGSVAALGYLLSNKKALGLIDSKLAMSVVKLTGLFYAAQMVTELQTYNIGGAFRSLAMGDFSGAMNEIGGSATAPQTYGTLGMAHGNVGGAHNNMGMYHVGGGHMGSVTNKKFFGAHNGAMMLPQNVSAPTAATQAMGGPGANAFFGTKGRGLGSSRVNLF